LLLLVFPFYSIFPRWIEAIPISLSLSFSGSTATVTGAVIGKNGTTSISATFYLQKRNSNGTFTTIKTWTPVSVNGSTLSFSNTYTSSTNITQGSIYRLCVSASVTNSAGSTEAVSDYMQKTYN
jgi:hypothetical protein